MRLSPTPIITERFFIGTPVYSEIPTFDQLLQEIREFAYKLAEQDRHQKSPEAYWLIAERVLFCGLEKTGINDIGYRVRANDRPMVITEKFPVIFKLLPGQPPPDRDLIHKERELFSFPKCNAVTLCGAMKKDV